MTPRCNNCLNEGAEIPMWGRVVWCRQCALDDGARGRRAIARHDHGNAAAGFTPDVLKAIAAGPIMDSNALYLPAGKCTAEEVAAREALRFDPPP